jgi:hypothetical protein
MHHRQNRLIQAALIFGILIGCQALALAQPSTNNQRPASVLFYNKYISSASNPQLQDTQINITNTNPNDPIAVHMFLVDGGTCSIADFYLNLTPNQTASFLTSDFDPGIVGYIVAVASSGGPTQFNWLVGDEYIREEDGKVANLQAYGVTKLTPGGVSSVLEGRARMTFDGVEYDQLPASVAVSSFNSQVTHSTTLNIYSPMSNLQTGNPVSNNIFTIVFNDSEDPFSTSVRFQCYGVIPLSTLRVTGGNVNVIVPAGRTGWIRLNGATRPLLGATIQRGPVFNGGHNLFPITYLPTYTIDVPNF